MHVSIPDIAAYALRTKKHRKTDECATVPGPVTFVSVLPAAAYLK
jgi:hypothetical protein